MAITLLSDHLINQIAAGEMVLRPASALKELLENSLDAGATRIEVEAHQGGLALLRVTDNGEGIPQEELALALQRHATSKLKRFEDLTCLSTFGFRGEALASLAAVARVRLVSRAREAERAYEAQRDPHGLCHVQPAHHALGTTVWVEGLFENLPARQKFLRSERSEQLALLEAFHGAALSTPGVELVFKTSPQKTLVHYPAVEGDQLEPRAERFLKQAKLHSTFAVRSTAVDWPYRLEGWIALGRRPVVRKLFVNRRWVRCLSTLQAVRSALHTAYRNCEFALPFGIEDVVQASFILSLQVPPESVDVNVHPAKEEVRFLEGRKVHAMVFKSCATAFDEHHQPRSAPFSESSPPSPSGEEAPLAFPQSSSAPHALHRQAELFKPSESEATAPLQPPRPFTWPEPKSTRAPELWMGTSLERAPNSESGVQTPLGTYLTWLRKPAVLLFREAEELVAYPLTALLVTPPSSAEPRPWPLPSALLVASPQGEATKAWAQLKAWGFEGHRFGEQSLLTHLPEQAEPIEPSDLWSLALEALEKDCEGWWSPLATAAPPRIAFREDWEEEAMRRWLKQWSERLQAPPIACAPIRRLSLLKWLS